MDKTTYGEKIPYPPRIFICISVPVCVCACISSVSWFVYFCVLKADCCWHKHYERDDVCIVYNLILDEQSYCRLCYCEDKTPENNATIMLLGELWCKISQLVSSWPLPRFISTDNVVSARRNVCYICQASPLPFFLSVFIYIYICHCTDRVYFSMPTVKLAEHILLVAILRRVGLPSSCLSLD